MKTKLVSLIVKLLNKSRCWFHSFTLFTGTAVQPYNSLACTAIWYLWQLTLCHVNHVIHIYTVLHKKQPGT